MYSNENQAELSMRAATVLYQYALAVDTEDLEALRALVTEDIQITRAEGTRSGMESFLDVYRAQFSSKTEGLKHVVTNVLADRLPDGSIQMHAYFEATMFDAEETRRIIGSYQDILREVDGVLKLAHKKISVQRVIQLPQATQAWVGAGVAAP